MNKRIKMAICCHNANGPTVCYCIINCTSEQYDNGDCYDAAIDFAQSQGYDGPMIAADENDELGKILLKEKEKIFHEWCI